MQKFIMSSIKTGILILLELYQNDFNLILSLLSLYYYLLVIPQLNASVLNWFIIPTSIDNSDRAFKSWYGMSISWK